MTKNLKNVLLASTAILSPIIINKAIFFKSNIENKEIYEKEFFNWRLGKINYKVYGSGRPILVIHGIGIGFSSHEWDKNIDDLSKKYKVYTIDLLGYGNSDKPKMTYTAYMYSSLINDFIENIIKKPTVVISSLLSCSFVLCAYKTKPNNYKKLIFIEPYVICKNIPKNDDIYLRSILESPIIGTSVYNILASKKMSSEKILNDGFLAKEKFINDDFLKNIYYSAHKGNSSAKYSTASYLSNFMNLDTTEIFKNVKIPLYIFWGENSTLNPIDNMYTLSKLRPDLDYTIFEKTRLFPHYENYLEFNNLIFEILK